MTARHEEVVKYVLLLQGKVNRVSHATTAHSSDCQRLWAVGMKEMALAAFCVDLSEGEVLLNVLGCQLTY